MINGNGNGNSKNTANHLMNITNVKLIPKGQIAGSKTSNTAGQFYKLIKIINDNNSKKYSTSNKNNKINLFESLLPVENKSTSPKLDTIFETFNKKEKKELLVDSIGAYFLKKNNSSSSENIKSNKVVEQKYYGKIDNNEKKFIINLAKIEREDISEAKNESKPIILKVTNTNDKKQASNIEVSFKIKNNYLNDNFNKEVIGDKKIKERIKVLKNPKIDEPLIINYKKSSLVYPALKEINDIISTSKFDEPIFLQGSKLAKIIDGTNTLVNKAKVNNLQIIKKRYVSNEKINSSEAKGINESKNLKSTAKTKNAIVKSDKTIIIEIRPQLLINKTMDNNKVISKSEDMILSKVEVKPILNQSLRSDIRKKNNFTDSDKKVMFQLSKLVASSSTSKHSNIQESNAKSIILEKNIGSRELTLKFVDGKKDSVIDSKLNNSKLVSSSNPKIQLNTLTKSNNPIMLEKNINSNESVPKVVAGRKDSVIDSKLNNSKLVSSSNPKIQLNTLTKSNNPIMLEKNTGLSELNPKAVDLDMRNDKFIKLKTFDSKIVEAITKEVVKNIKRNVYKNNDSTIKQDLTKPEILNSKSFSRISKEIIGIVNRTNKLQSNSRVVSNLDVSVNITNKDNMVNKVTIKITPELELKNDTKKDSITPKENKNSINLTIDSLGDLGKKEIKQLNKVIRVEKSVSGLKNKVENIRIYQEKEVINKTIENKQILDNHSVKDNFNDKDFISLKSKTNVNTKESLEKVDPPIPKQVITSKLERSVTSILSEKSKNVLQKETQGVLNKYIKDENISNYLEIKKELVGKLKNYISKEMELYEIREKLLTIHNKLVDKNPIQSSKKNSDNNSNKSIDNKQYHLDVNNLKHNQKLVNNGKQISQFNDFTTKLNSTKMSDEVITPKNIVSNKESNSNINKSSNTNISKIEDTIVNNGQSKTIIENNSNNTNSSNNNNASNNNASKMSNNLSSNSPSLNQYSNAEKAKFMQNLIKGFSHKFLDIVNQGKSKNSLLLTLNPHKLGKIKVEIVKLKDSFKIEFQFSKKETKAMMQESKEKLVETLKDKGVEVKKFDLKMYKNSDSLIKFASNYKNVNTDHHNQNNQNANDQGSNSQNENGKYQDQPDSNQNKDNNNSNGDGENNSNENEQPNRKRGKNRKNKQNFELLEDDYSNQIESSYFNKTIREEIDSYEYLDVS